MAQESQEGKVDHHPFLTAITADFVEGRLTEIQLMKFAFLGFSEVRYGLHFESILKRSKGRALPKS